MSFGLGGAQGTVRYALLVDDAQATQAITRFKSNVNTLNLPTSQLSTNMGKLNSTFAAGVSPIKTQGNALTTLKNNLNSTGQTATTLGTKIKDTASKFAGFATGLAVTASGVLQLAAGFRDYNDAQIAVDRVQRKLSLATEAQGKAVDKLNALTGKGIKSGKDYEQAQLDVSQANAAVSIQTDLLGEAQERLFDSQTQFAVSIIPTTLGALGTLGSAFKDLGGTGGIGGLVTKFKDFGGGIKGSVIPAIASLVGGGGLGGLSDKIKDVISSAGGMKSAFLGIGLPVFAGLGGGLLILDDVNKTMEKLDKVGLKFTRTSSTLWDTKSVDQLNKSTAELDEVLKRTHASLLEFRLAPEAVMKRFIEAGGKIDKFGNIVVTVTKKTVQANTDLSNAEAKLGRDEAKLKSLQQERQTSYVKHEIEVQKAVIASDKAQIARLKTEDATAKKIAQTTKDLTDNTKQWKLQTEALQGGTVKNLNLTSKAYLDVHNAVVKTNPEVMKNANLIKENAAMQKAMGSAVKNSTAFIHAQDATYSVFGDTLDNLKNKFKTLNGQLGTMGFIIKNIGKFPSADRLLFDKLLSGGNPTAITKTAKEWANIKASTQITLQHVRDLVTNANNVQPAIEKAKEEAAKFKEIMASSDKAFKGLFKIDSNVDKIFKDLVKGLPNKLEKKIKLQLKFEQKVDDQRQSFIDFLGRATKLNDKDAEKMANEVIDTIDKKFKGKKGAFAELRASLEAAIADPNTPEKLRQLLINMKVPDIPIHIIPPAQILPPIKEPVKVPSVLTPPPPITPPKEPVKVPSVFTPPPPIPSPKTPVKVPAVLELATNFNLANLWETAGNKSPVKVPVAPFPQGQPENKNNPKLTEWDRTHFLGNPWDIQDRMALFGKTKKGGAGNAQLGTQEGDEMTDFFFGRPLEGRTKRPKPLIPTFKDTPSTLPTSSGNVQSFANAKPQINIEMALKQIDVLAKRIMDLSKIQPIITLMNTAAIKAIDVIAVRLASLTGIAPVINLINAKAIKAIDVIAIRINDLAKVIPTLSVVNAKAIKAVDVIAKRIMDLAGLKPTLQVQNSKAIKAVDVIAKRIDDLAKIKPTLQVQNSKAIKAVDVVANRIMDLEKLHPTVTVKVKTVGGAISAAKGLHAYLLEDTTIMAHKGERVDIGQGSETRGGGITFNSGGGGGDIFIENHTHVGDRDFIRMVRAEQGKNRYRFGLG